MRSRVDKEALFRGIVGKGKNDADENEMEKRIPEPGEGEIEEPKASRDAAKKPGRKADKEKKIQVSIYLTQTQARELRIQDALKEKETDKSSIARMGLEIVLTLSKETYATLKEEANNRGVSPGAIVEEALRQYL